MSAIIEYTYWPHQADFLKKNPPRAILAWEMRTGKSLPAAVWIDLPEQAGNTYIICPKQLKKGWLEMGTKATVLTKEEFKKLMVPTTKLNKPTAIVVDEAHFFASALFIRKGKGRSQLATALYTLIKNNPDMHVLLLTATPVRQDPWSLHTLLCYIGVYYDYKKYQAEFFDLVKLPFLAWPIWQPKRDWRIKIRPYLEKHCDIVSLRQVVDSLPPMTPEIVTVKHPTYVKPEDTVVNWMHEHRYEQVDKYKEILHLGDGFRKMIVVAYYTEQIDSLYETLKVHKPTFVLDGRTTDAAATIQAAQQSDDCYFIVQSSMGFGFDGWMFSTIVFASMSHRCVDHTQMLGRLRHLEHLRALPVYYVMGGRWDRRIYQTIEKGKDFNPHEYDREVA